MKDFKVPILFMAVFSAFALVLTGCGDGYKEGDNAPLSSVYNYYAYVANLNSNNISAYTINATTGALTAIAGSPFAAGTQPFSVITTRVAQ